MATIDQRIAALETKLKEEKAKKQQLEARKRAAQSKADRALDTRRKILVGGFILAQMRQAGIGVEMLTCEGKRFTDSLTRPNDRDAFGWAPRA